MDHEEPRLIFSNLPDVTISSLSALLREDDPVLNAAIRDLVAALKEPTEVTLGWNNYVERHPTSTQPNSTS
jgi:hypothetical protein